MPGHLGPVLEFEEGIMQDFVVDINFAELWVHSFPQLLTNKSSSFFIIEWISQSGNSGLLNMLYTIFMHA